MGAKQAAETRAGLALLTQGMSVRKAAKAVGVAPSTLMRAKAREAAAKVLRKATTAPKK
jgi:transposase